MEPEINPANMVAHAAPIAPNFMIKGMFNPIFKLIPNMSSAVEIWVFLTYKSCGILPKNIDPYHIARILIIGMAP